MSPVPHFIKMRILKSAKNVDVWIETGTYMGLTTDFLHRIGSSVVSIEASKELASKQNISLNNTPMSGLNTAFQRMN